MSKFITDTQIKMLKTVKEIVNSNGIELSGVYPTDSIAVYIVSTWREDVYQTVNAITREIQNTTQADFAAFVEGQR
tara:strand:- start:295 stop:522 length:228 start_codon:yes stop_codon:yes gene_type:complete